jgi:NADH-quinone oxidoreductase subunit C
MTTTSTPRIAALSAAIEARLPGLLQRAPSLADELCYEVQPDKLKEVCLALRDSPEFKFEILVDVAGIDYLDYATTEWKTYSATTSGFSRGVNRGGARVPHDGARFAVA